MVLPLLFGALAPSLFTGMSPLIASAIGSGVGGLVQSGGDLEEGLLTGLGAFAGGALMGGLTGGAGAAASAANGGTGAVGMNLPAAASGAKGVASLPMNAKLASVGNPAAPMNVPAGGGIKGMMGGAMDFMKSPTGMGASVGAMAGPMLAGSLGFGGDDEDSKSKSKSKYGAKEPKPIPRIPTMPGAGYSAGRDGEFDYGISTPYSAEQIMGYANGGMLQRMARPNIPGVGPVRLAGGGIVALAEGGDPGKQMPNEKEVISEAVMAVKGQHPQPEIALGAFLAMFGEEALRQLVDSVKGGEIDDTVERFAEGENGEVKGPGDGSGTDDMVPAKMDDGSGDVLLSDGEFVMRKDAVDAIEKKFGGGTLDSVNKAGPKAAEVAKRRMSAA
jgi:hypothetical protein